ncbi:MAG: hypothetical protein RBS27_15235, partial [Giesbergeria sp.]|nr:hypothetical protein [Giesbergeria sp.]
MEIPSMKRTTGHLPFLLSLAFLTACSSGDPAIAVTEPLTASSVAQSAPIAEKRPYEVIAPGGTRVDEYYWLRDDTRQDAKMLAYLKAENGYTDAAMALLAEPRETLYQEMVGRLKQDDATAPYLYKDYWYYSRFEEGKDYKVHARRKGSMNAPEEILLDLNELSQGHSYYSVDHFTVSPDQKLLAFVEDTSGRRQYTLRIKNLETGAIADTGVAGISPSLAWAADSATIVYVWNDPDTLLSKQIKSHRIGTSPTTDALLYQEPDDSFYLGVGVTRSERYICIYAESTLSDEQRCADANKPDDFQRIAERQPDFKYTADHLGGRWVVRTNWNAPNFKLMSVTDGLWNSRSQWSDLVPHDPAVLISGFELFDNVIALNERFNGLTRIRLRSNAG